MLDQKALAIRDALLLAEKTIAEPLPHVLVDRRFRVKPPHPMLCVLCCVLRRNSLVQLFIFFLIKLLELILGLIFKNLHLEKLLRLQVDQADSIPVHCNYCRICIHIKISIRRDKT